MSTLQQYLYPITSYHGNLTPENLLFDANLQEYAQKVGYISALFTSGKLSPQESYAYLSDLWEQLSRSVELSGIEDC